MSKLRILVVEDEKVVAADIEECVKGLGYEVTGTAASGTEALRYAVNGRPDLVLMDIKLKGTLDGIDVAVAISQDLKIPVVYLTAHADAEILERAKKTAPAGYVLKPFDVRTLRTEIEIAFDRHRRERDLIEGSQRLATALGSIDEAVIVTHRGQVTLMNRVAESLTGWSRDEALGRAIGDVFVLLNSDTGSLQPSVIGRVQREGISVGLGERILLLSKKGMSTHIQGSAAPANDGEGNIGVCLLFRSAAHRAADEKWGGEDHSTTGRLEIIGTLATAVAAKLAVLLQHGNASQAARLANRLLLFGERQPQPPIALDLNALIGSLEDLLRCALGDDIELTFKLAENTGTVKTDAGQIELILIHLALSARQASASGRLRIETAVAEDSIQDSYAMIEVTPPDNGRYSVTDLPSLDEIVRHSPGEIRIARENGVVHIYLPRIVADGQPR
jgi:PAS domain S-box-containing protein